MRGLREKLFIDFKSGDYLGVNGRKRENETSFTRRNPKSECRKPALSDDDSPNRVPVTEYYLAPLRCDRLRAGNLTAHLRVKPQHGRLERADVALGCRPTRHAILCSQPLAAQAASAAARQERIEAVSNELPRMAPAELSNDGRRQLRSFDRWHAASGRSWSGSERTLRRERFTL